MGQNTRNEITGTNGEKNRRRGSGDRVLESRHLIGLFLGVVMLVRRLFHPRLRDGQVAICGLGARGLYARAQISPSALAVEREGEAAGELRAAPRPAGEWDFYADKNNNHLEPAPQRPVSPARLRPMRQPITPAALSLPPEDRQAIARVSSSPRIPRRRRC